MKFGIFYEHQLPRPWGEGDELKLFQDALTQVELADRLGIEHLLEVVGPGCGRRYAEQRFALGSGLRPPRRSGDPPYGLHPDNIGQKGRRLERIPPACDSGSSTSTRTHAPGRPSGASTRS